MKKGMGIISNSYCINERCKDYGVKNSNNIRTRGIFGVNKDRQLLYCKTCGKRFSESQRSAFFGLRLGHDKINQIIQLASKGEGIRPIGRKLGIDKDAVNRVVLKAEKHCEVTLSNLLDSLKLDKTQLDTLFSFLKHRKTFKK